MFDAEIVFHQMLTDVISDRGEGLMAMEPRSFYEHGRSHSILKFKVLPCVETKRVAHGRGVQRKLSFVFTECPRRRGAGDKS